MPFPEPLKRHPEMFRKRTVKEQRITDRFPILNIEEPPRFDPEAWTLTVEGLVEKPGIFSWAEFSALPTEEQVSDFHCITGWSKVNNRWRGIRLQVIAGIVKPLPEAKFITFSTVSREYYDWLTLEEAFYPDVMIALEFEGKPLEAVHGGPARLLTPSKWAYKAVKWVRHIEFTDKKVISYWAQYGYSNEADLEYE
ncbi:MAG: molybdopterin-dependent oxidoreductase [Actinobacteria bacterium]|nr:molybdopterin-dependent oxidoreductase [Actinomycetota bacterium]